MRQSWASASHALPPFPSPSTDERIRFQRFVKKRPMFPAPPLAVSGDMAPVFSEIASALTSNAGGRERPAISSRSLTWVAGRELTFASTGGPATPGEEAALTLGRRAALRAELVVFAGEWPSAGSRDGSPERRLSIATFVLRKSPTEVLRKCSDPAMGGRFGRKA